MRNLNTLYAKMSHDVNSDAQIGCLDGLLGWFSQSEFFEVVGHFAPDGGELGFQGGDFLFHGVEVDFGLLLEGIDVARDVEVEVVVGEFLRGGAVGVFLDGLEGLVGGDDFFEVLVGEDVLVFRILELAGGVDEEDVAVGLALVEEQDGKELRDLAGGVELAGFFPASEAKRSSRYS